MFLRLIHLLIIKFLPVKFVNSSAFSEFCFWSCQIQKVWIWDRNTTVVSSYCPLKMFENYLIWFTFDIIYCFYMLCIFLEKACKKVLYSMLKFVFNQKLFQLVKYNFAGYILFKIARVATDAPQNANFWKPKWKMRFLAFEWAQNKTVKVNSLEVTELESCNFDCSFKSLLLQYPW